MLLSSCHPLLNRFTVKNGITHLQSPPYHSQLNGRTERVVDTIKTALVRGGVEDVPEQVIGKLSVFYGVTPNPEVLDGKSPAVYVREENLDSF